MPVKKKVVTKKKAAPVKKKAAPKVKLAPPVPVAEAPALKGQPTVRAKLRYVLPMVIHLGDGRDAHVTAEENLYIESPELPLKPEEIQRLISGLIVLRK